MATATGPARPPLRPAGAALVLGLLVFGLAGCRSFPGFRPTAPASPVVFEKSPSLPELIAAVNANAAPIRHLQADGISLSMAGMPALKGNLAVERPARLHVTASLLGFGGAGVDAGTNEEYFFLWPTYADPPTVYWARHEEFARSPLRGRLPLEPTFLVDAMGLLTIDPAGQHEGPFFPRPGEIELISRLPTPTGTYRRVLVIDNKYGWITEQHYYDPGNRPVLSVHSSGHRYFPDSRATLPLTHRINLPTLPATFTLEVSNYQINRATGETAETFAGPRPAGAEFVDLVEHPEVLTGPGGATLAPPATAGVGPGSSQTVQRPVPAGGLVYRPDGQDVTSPTTRFEGPRTLAPPASQAAPADPWSGPASAANEATPRPLGPPLAPTPTSREATRPSEATVAAGSAATLPLGRGAAGYSLFESDEALVAAIRRVLPGRGAIVRGQSPSRSEGMSSPAGGAPYPSRLGRPGWR